MNNNLDIKMLALEEAISYPSLKKQDFGDACTIEVSAFEYEAIEKQIINNEKLTNFEGTKIDLILDVVKILSEHKIKYNIELHNVIGLYFRGLPLLIIKINNEQNNNVDRMVYLSLKVYRDELTQGLSDRKLTKIIAAGLGGILLSGVAFVGYKLLKSA